MHPAEKFFKTLYAGQTGVLELRTFGPDKTDTKEAEQLSKAANKLRDFIPVEGGEFDFDRVSRFLNGCEVMKLGAFFGVALRNKASLKSRKGGAESLQTLTALFVDADYKHLGEEETRKRIDAFQIPVSLIVASGGGLHPYWILRAPIQLGTSQGMNRAKSYLSRLAHSISDVVDVSVSEPARVLRIPGSKNFKRAYGNPRDVVLEHQIIPTEESDGRYVLTSFDQVLPKAEDAPTQQEVAGQFSVPADINQGDRHTLIYKFLRSQKARGVGLDVALVGCLELNRTQCKPPIDETELRAYLERVWNQNDSPQFKEQAADQEGFLRHPETSKILAKNQFNIRLALKKLSVTLTFNEFSQKPMVTFAGYKGVYQDEQRNQIWLAIDRKFHFQPPDTYFDIVLSDLARQNPYHPVRDYLESLQWDGIPRIDEWLIAYGGAGDSEYTRAVSRIVLIAAVRRVFKPGCKFDELVVLESEQGLQKSTALRALCDDESWFSDDIPLNVDAKQIIERTAGKWIIEAAELSGMHASKVEHLKAMLSRQVDGPVRMAYARLPVEQPRQFIIFGTTNSHSYLEDATGNRRFWPVRVENFLICELRRDKDQLWAEAVYAEKHNASIRLDPALYQMAEVQQERRRAWDPWEDIIEREFPQEYQRIPPTQIWKALGIPSDRQDAKSQKRINVIMQRLKFKRLAVRDPEQDNRVVKGWARGEQLTQQKDDLNEQFA